jgi:hypothetical protein
MKPALFIFFWLLLFYHQSNGQLKVDAGNDVIVCASYNEEYKDVKLGGCPTASGGVEPYSYTWSGKMKPFPSLNYWVFASDVLEDSTKSNPVLRRDPPENWMTLYLTVRDAENNIACDSVKIRASTYTIYTIGARKAEIKKGDSVQFYGNPFFESNFFPLTFVITPSEGLADSIDIFGWVKPDTSTAYFLQATNPIGCKSRNLFYLYVEVDTSTTSASSVNLSNNQCFFDNGQLVLYLNNKHSSPYMLTISTINGVIVHSGKYGSLTLKLSNLNLRKHQIYMVSITDLNKKTVFKLANN